MRKAYFDAGVAQLVERNLAKVEVTSSSLVTRSKIRCLRMKGIYGFLNSVTNLYDFYPNSVSRTACPALDYETNSVT